MILPDANLMIYAANRDSPHHRTATRWLEAALSSGEELRLAWIVILAFLRITTKKGVFSRPMTVESAFSIVQRWLDHPSISIAHPGPEHVQILRRLLRITGAAGDLTTDAHLAALALEYDAELCSSDHDFARFPGLRWKNPLAPPLK
jgi:hypothetical protein